jgi:hypothetical protein
MGPMNRLIIGLELCALVMGGAAHAAQSTRAAPAASASRDYRALEKLPDWSGIWSFPAPNEAQFNARVRINVIREFAQLPPLRDQDRLAKYMDGLAESILRERESVTANEEVKKGAAPPAPASGNGAGVPGKAREIGGGLCGEPSFSGGFTGRVDGMLEFLLTPGRVTIINQAGMVRTIYTDRPMPADPFATVMGTSIGHWEGDTLVVQTRGLSPRTIVTGGVPAGEGFKVDERIHLNANHTLQIDAVITAPEVYTEPHKITQVLSDNPDKSWMLSRIATDCGPTLDRDRDRATNKEIFDLTPPADLPPPPPPRR